MVRSMTARPRVSSEQARQILGEDYDLFLTLKNGSEIERTTARNQLWKRHCHLSWKAALVYHARYYRHRSDRDSRIQAEDLAHEGYFGLVKAIEDFDPHLGWRFSTYARFHIRHSLQNAVARNLGFSTMTYGLMIKAKKIIQQCIASDKKVPDVDELAKCLDIKPRRLKKLLLADAQNTTRRQQATEDICDPRKPDSSQETQEQISKALGVLTLNERTVVSGYYGLNDNDPKPFRVLSRQLGRSRGFVEKTFKRALAKMKAVF